VAAPTGVYVGAVRSYPDSLKDPNYVTVLNRQYNLNTAENACKWAATQPQQNQFTFTQCDYVANATLHSSSVFRGHNLCWGQGNPSWLTNGGFNGNQLTQILQNHINVVVGRYKGQFLCWDVVNEAVNDNGNGLKSNVWYPAVPNYIDIAFRAARAADSNVKLFYNDYGGEGLNTKSEYIYQLVSGMKQRGVPIDGVGLQMHVSISYYPPPDQVSANIKRLGALGLQVHITEMDVACPDPCNANQLQTQATIYRAMAQACLQNSNCKCFESWGYTDKYTWLGTNNHPLPFDTSLNPKPAAFSIEAAYKAAAQKVLSKN